MSKYTGEKLDFIISEMKENKLNITQAAKKMCEKFGIKYKDSIRRSVSSLLDTKRKKEGKEKIKSEDFDLARKREYDKRRNTFIITWAQNSTPIHKQFFENVKAYSKEIKAGLHVVAGRYNNPTSIFTKDQVEGEWWVEDVKPYLDANRHNVHELLQVLSDVKISPTSALPLSGLNSVTGLESCIVGHPRQHLKSLPILDGYPHKLLLSTGACTIENYTDSRAGKKGEFHHTLGFVIVELDGKHFHVRQVSADENGNFYDLFHRVKNGKVKKNKKGCEVAIPGDIHVAHNDPKATSKFFELLDVMKPNHTMIHDLLDCESISHWDTKDPFKMMYKEENEIWSMQNEIDLMLKWTKEHLKYNLVVVRSNHDDMFDRWLKFSDWRKGANKRVYLESAVILAEQKVAQEKGVLSYIIENEFGENIKTLGLDDSYRVLGWELGMHGHVGANGSRGGANQFKTMNTKTITGHTHQPIKVDGHMSVGTLTHLRVGYNKGLSSWMQTNILIYPDGKAQHLHFVNGKYHR